MKFELIVALASLASPAAAVIPGMDKTMGLYQRSKDNSTPWQRLASRTLILPTCECAPGGVGRIAASGDESRRTLQGTRWLTAYSALTLEWLEGTF